MFLQEGPARLGLKRRETNFTLRVSFDNELNQAIAEVTDPVE